MLVIFSNPNALNCLTFTSHQSKRLSFFSLQVIVAVLPKTRMLYFDIEEKQWKQLSSLAPAAGAGNCLCAEIVGKQLFVAGYIEGVGYSTYCYDIETNKWQRHKDYALPCHMIRSLCTLGDYIYAVPTDCRNIPQRYSFPKRQWQSIAKLTPGCYSDIHYHNNGATVLHSKLYVLSGVMLSNSSTGFCNAVLHCFDPATNLWEKKGSTCQSHFGSSLFSVNGRLCVAGGYNSIDTNNRLSGNPAAVEVYDEDNNKWSVVDQKHIPQNTLGAVEIEGRVYFIINKFPIDSGIRIPPGEVYPVYLGDWKNLVNVDKTAALCYVPLKKGSVKAD